MIVLVFLVIALVAFILSGFSAKAPPLNFDGIGKAALVAAALAGWSL